MKNRRFWLLLAVFLAGFRFGVWAAELVARWNGDQIKISAPAVHFLAGRPLDDLKNGAAVTYAFELTLFAGRRDFVQQKSYERFTVSYDLWEERFAVTRLRNARSASNLTAAAAEEWCLDNVDLPAAAVPPDKPLWLKLDIRVEERRSRAGIVGEPGINLARLVELFSQPRPGREAGWLVETGPFQSKDIRKRGAG